MANAPLVSIIIPAYNCESTISETLTYLFAQEYQPIEIIVVNDGSKDNSLELLKTYGDKIRLIDQANSGAPSARNCGILAATGEFVSFCDADDLWSPQKVSEQVRYFAKNPNVGMVYCDWYVWNAESNGRFVVPESFIEPEVEQQIDQDNSGWIYHKLLLDCICLTSTVMIRKSIIDQVGLFDTQLFSGEDYDYWLRISRVTEVLKLKAQMVLYRILSHSISRTPTPVHYEYQVLQNAISRWGTASPNGVQVSLKALRRRFAQMQFDFGYMHYNSGGKNIAIRSFWNSIMNSPGWYLPWIYLFLSIWKRSMAREYL